MNIYTENHRIKRIKFLINKAQVKNGDVEARHVLYEAMVALSHVIDGTKISPSQTEAIKFVHESLREFLTANVPIEHAFCVDKAANGQRKDIHGEDVFYILHIDDEVTKQIQSTGTPNITNSLRIVANKFSHPNDNVSASRLKQAWDRLGSFDGYKIRNDIM